MYRGVPQAALDLVKTSEGFRSTRYHDPVGRVTIGYGHALKPVDPYWNAVLSQESACELALDDLETAGQQLESILGSALIQSLSDGQWAALLDFTFNLGAGTFEGSTLCAMLKAGAPPADCASQFGRWVYGKVNGQDVKLQGLVTRRQAETDLWNG